MTSQEITPNPKGTQDYLTFEKSFYPGALYLNDQASKRRFPY